MKRIAIDCRLAQEGGVGRYIRNLVYHLSLLDTENEYTLYTYGNSKFKIQNLKSISNFEFRISNSHWHTISEQLQFWKELEAGNYDLVHFPYFSHPIFYRRPFVVTIHDLTIMHFSTGKATTKNPFVYKLKRLGYMLALQHAIAVSKRILAPTNFVRRDIEQSFHVKPEKIMVTYEGVGEKFMNLASKKPVIVQQYKDYFLYVGNFYPHKNVEFLLQSFKDLKRGSALVLAGPDDFFSSRIRNLIGELKLSDRVVLFKPTDEELEYLYQHAKALVLPSLFEGFGLPVLEATYFNCPLLLSNIPVFKEIAVPNTQFFDPKNKEDLVKKLSTKITFNKPDEHYFKRFSFEKMSQDTLRVYKNAW